MLSGVRLRTIVGLKFLIYILMIANGVYFRGYENVLNDKAFSVQRCKIILSESGCPFLGGSGVSLWSFTFSFYSHGFLFLYLVMPFRQMLKFSNFETKKVYNDT